MSFSQEQLAGMSREQLMAIVAQAKAQAKVLPQGLTLKVSAKGAVSVYGLGRFPVTLYSSQWERLIQDAEKITAFLAANAQVLKHKE